MAFTYTWNSTFEALPADANNVSDGANKIRNLKNALRERFATDHYFDIAGTDADHGEHSKITFHANAATPSNVANKAFLFSQVANGIMELKYKDGNGTVTQITANGAVNAPASPIPVNTVMIFYADTAPSGWTIKNTAEWDDITVMLSRGSANGGATGGANHANGTWTINVTNHVHPWGSLDASRQLWSYRSNGANIQVSDSGSASTGSGTDKWLGTVASANANLYTSNQVAANANSWRPKAKVFICCQKS